MDITRQPALLRVRRQVRVREHRAVVDEVVAHTYVGVCPPGVLAIRGRRTGIRPFDEVQGRVMTPQAEGLCRGRADIALGESSRERSIQEVTEAVGQQDRGARTLGLGPAKGIRVRRIGKEKRA